jgi:hypothetical protein
VGSRLKVFNIKKDYPAREIITCQEMTAVIFRGPNLIILGFKNGMIRLINPIGNAIEKEAVISFGISPSVARSTPSIIDIKKTSNDDEYAILTRRGIYIFEAGFSEQRGYFIQQINSFLKRC